MDMNPSMMKPCPSGLPPIAAGNVALIAILTATMTVTVSLRAYARLRVVKAFWWDDALIIAAVVLELANLWMIVWMNIVGYGNYDWCVNPSVYSVMGKVAQASNVVGLVAVTLGRISVAVLLYRLFKIERIVTYLLSSVMLVMVALAVVNIGWLIKEEHRYSTAFTWASSVSGAVADIFLATIPVFVLQKIQMKRSLKAAVIGVLALGYITCVFAMVRLVLFGTLDPNSTPGSSAYALKPEIASELEGSCAIIVANIPTLRPLFSKDRQSQASRPTAQHHPLAEASYSKDSGRKPSYSNYGAFPPRPSAARAVGKHARTEELELDDIESYPETRSMTVYLARDRMNSETV